MVRLLARAATSLSRLRHQVAARRWDAVPSTIAPTVSIGLATSSPGDSDTRATLLARSDELLYRAKRAGRNRVVSDESALPSLPPHPAPADPAGRDS